METLQALQTLTIDLARRGAALIAELARSVFERRVRVAKPVAAVGTCELAVDENGDGAWAGV